jgi:hypothetical protein
MCVCVCACVRACVRGWDTCVQERSSTSGVQGPRGQMLHPWAGAWAGVPHGVAPPIRRPGPRTYRACRRRPCVPATDERPPSSAEIPAHRHGACCQHRFRGQISSPPPIPVLQRYQCAASRGSRCAFPAAPSEWSSSHSMGAEGGLRSVAASFLVHRTRSADVRHISRAEASFPLTQSQLQPHALPATRTCSTSQPSAPRVPLRPRSRHRPPPSLAPPRPHKERRYATRNLANYGEQRVPTRPRHARLLGVCTTMYHVRAVYGPARMLRGSLAMGNGDLEAGEAAHPA